MYVKRSEVLEILYNCIVGLDESDQALVNYEIAKSRIMDLPEKFIVDDSLDEELLALCDEIELSDLVDVY